MPYREMRPLREVPPGATVSGQSVKTAAWDKGWIAGVAYSAQIMVTACREESYAAELIEQSGLSYNDFDSCDPYDRKEVRKLFRTEPRLRDLYEARKR